MTGPALSERDLAVIRSFARRIDPLDAGANNNLGVLYHQKGLTAEAINDIDRADDGTGGVEIVEGSSAEVQHLVFNMDDPVAGKPGARSVTGLVIGLSSRRRSPPAHFRACAPARASDRRAERSRSCGPSRPARRCC